MTTMKFRNLSLSFSATSLRDSSAEGLEKALGPERSVIPIEQIAFGAGLLEADPYEAAGFEFLNGKVVPGLWARATIEGDGDEGRTRAAYITLRVENLQSEAEQTRQDEEVAARLNADRKEARRLEVAEFASENGVTFEDAEAMITHGIKKEGGKFVLDLSDGGLRYSYDRLSYAVQYSKDWTRLRVPPPPNGKVS